MRNRLASALWFLSGVLLTLAALSGHAPTVAWGAETPTPPPPLGLWERTVGTVSETAGRYTSDEAVADYIVAALQKQERVNKILAHRGSRFRISDMRVSVSVPPALEVGVAELAGEEAPAPTTMRPPE